MSHASKNKKDRDEGERERGWMDNKFVAAVWEVDPSG